MLCLLMRFKIIIVLGWTSLKNYFRDPQGDYVLFGDVKQNIYGQPTSQKDVVTNVRGVTN